MSRGRWRDLSSYGAAVVCIAAAWLLTQIPIIGDGSGTAAILAMLAVMVAARWAGTGPGLFTTLLVVAIAWPDDPTAGRLFVRLLLYAIGGIAISLSVGSLRESRRRAEADAERLRQSERAIERLNADLGRRVAELNALLEVIPVGIGIAEDPSAERIRVNEYFGRLLGLEPGANASLSAPAGERPSNFRVFRGGREVDPDDLPLQAAAKRGIESRGLELDVVHQDGRVITLLESASPLRDQAGVVRGSVGAFLDVTELRRMREDLIRARDAALEASRTKDLFLAMLSHELRTPLAPALLALSELMDDTRTPPSLRADLEPIRQGIALEARLVDDLLDATRAGVGKLRLVMQRVDAHDVVRQALASCARDAESSGLTLRHALAARRTHVQADPVRLQQVLWNLLKNACKFTPAGGRVEVATRDDPGPDGSTSWLQIEVRDTGVGMDAELIGRVFRPFEQGGEGQQRPGGLGLGLAIARTIAEAHGGRLSAASNGPGRGSVFALDLPSAPEAGAVAASNGEADDRHPLPRRMLLVEDDPATSSVLVRVLRRRGADVTAVGRLAEARTAAEAASFDLVISDLGLPDGSGLELARWLSARGRTPAIALSGYGSDDDIRRSLEAGFRAHLTKPVDIASLEAAIRRAAATPGVG